MTDSQQFATSTTESEMVALADADNALRGYPCCGCSDAPNPKCPCTAHRYPDGKPAPHQGSCTLRQAEVQKHPDRDEWAYPCDAKLVEAVSKGAPKIDDKTRAAIAAKVASAKALPVDWIKANPLAADVAADVKAEAAVADLAAPAEQIDTKPKG